MGYVTYNSLSMLSSVGGISSTLAVGLAGVVVVVTVVLVFIMLLRSNGAGKRTASGLGYDAQQAPFGPPPNDPGAEWPAPRGANVAPGWPQTDHYEYGSAPQSAGARGGNWDPGYGGQVGQMGQMGQMGQIGGTGPTSQSAWSNSPAPGAGWAGVAGPAGPSAGWGEASPSAWENQNDQWGQNPPGWDAQPASSSRPAANSSGGWESSRGGHSVPGSNPLGSNPLAGQWGDQGGVNPQWGAAAAAPQREWSSAAPAPASPAGAAWGGTAQSSYDNSFGEAEKTRIARPNTGQQRVGMIVIRQGKEPGRVFELRKDRLTIGRSRESDIFLEDLAVSRLHTTVNSDGNGHYIIRDEGSANGTYVNQQRVTEQALEEGDEIQVGQTVLAFVRR
ncbi:MAG: FHA domain-containing protein [Ktedonobacterales bacterium]